jgi:hypothetical protein
VLTDIFTGCDKLPAAVVFSTIALALAPLTESLAISVLLHRARLSFYDELVGRENAVQEFTKWRQKNPYFDGLLGLSRAYRGSVLMGAIESGDPLKDHDVGLTAAAEGRFVGAVSGSDGKTYSVSWSFSDYVDVAATNKPGELGRAVSSGILKMTRNEMEAERDAIVAQLTNLDDRTTSES